MRAWPIEITREEFNLFLYKYTTNVCSKDVAESLISNRLLEKLQDPTITERHDPPQEDIDAAEEADEFWWPHYTLEVDAHTFLFEEDEKRLAIKRLEANIGRLPPRVGPPFEVMRRKFVDAEAIDLTPEPEELEEKDSAAERDPFEGAVAS